MAKRVLLLSEKNNGWTLIAEAMARALFPDLDVQSAGTDPDGGLELAAFAVLRELGISPHALEPKPLAHDAPLGFDVVVLDSQVPLETVNGLQRAARIQRAAFELPSEEHGFFEQRREYRELCDSIRGWLNCEFSCGPNALSSGERARSLVSWIDERRKSLYERSGATLAADAILAAAAFLLLGETPGIFSDDAGAIALGTEGWVYIICLFIAGFLLVSSVTVATLGLGNIFKRRSTLWAGIGYIDQPGQPSFFPFYPRDLDEMGSRYSDYVQEFRSVLTDDAHMVRSAAAQFRLTSREFLRRYQCLRWAVRLLFASVFPFGIAIGALMVRLFKS